jgi:hypothetical protein
MKYLDRITILSFLIGLYALYIALENLDENRAQNGELKDILSYLENHLQDQDNHLHSQDEHLKKQDDLIKSLAR